jgi:flagellar basal-body rod protein FlgC
MSAQRTRAELLVENLANSETTRTPEGGPYKRKDAIFSTAPVHSPFAAVFQDEMNGMAGQADTAAGVTGVEVSEIIQDQREPDRRYLPNHPDADANGYVAFPRLNPAEDMADLVSASRGFQSNIAAMNAIKDMLHKSIDLMR